MTRALENGSDSEKSGDCSSGKTDSFMRLDVNSFAAKILSNESRDTDQLLRQIQKLVSTETACIRVIKCLRERAIATRWGVGRYLCRVKELLEHGGFSPWLEENLDTLGFSLRTAQNYMRLYQEHPSPEKLQEYLDELSEQRTSDTIPEVSQANEERRESGEDISKSGRSAVVHPTRVEKCLKGFSSLQSRLRQLVESDESPTDEEFAQFQAVKHELDQLFKEVEGGAHE
ncbi:DUF3102 domain-containing protein [Roseibacillus persicicus]|uniref:DUF3102 domain-containing protein n=1 Tax=Roseibacillus persicicus TaxID=454148 RepID=UPI00398B364C